MSIASPILNQSTSGTNNYKSKPCGSSRKGEKVFTISWVITGTVTGTLWFEGSNSPEETIAKDVGDVANQTDKATWIRIQPIYDNTDTLVASGSIAITNSTTDAMILGDPAVGFNSIRAVFTNATGTSTVVITCTSRERC